MLNRIFDTAAVAAVLALAAGSAAAAPRVPAEPTEAQSIAQGRALVRRNCAMCHAVGATSLSRDPEAPPFRQLNERLNIDGLGEGLATGILTSHPAMPQFRFAPQEVNDIVRYLKSVQAKARA